jgi:hypothetical protein
VPLSIGDSTAIPIWKSPFQAHQNQHTWGPDDKKSCDPLWGGRTSIEDWVSQLFLYFMFIRAQSLCTSTCRAKRNGEWSLVCPSARKANVLVWPATIYAKNPAVSPNSKFVIMPKLRCLSCRHALACA